MLSTDPADLFCEVYDELDPAAFLSRRIFDWRDDDGLRTISASIESGAVSGSLSPAEVEHLLTAPGADQAHRFAILRGLDRALAHAHPQWSSSRSLHPILQRVKTRYVIAKRFNEHAGGALLPRFSHAWQAATALEDPADAFSYVVRVGADRYGRAIHHCRPRAVNEPGRLRRERLTVGCAPVLEDLDDVHIELPGDRYRLAPRGSVETRLEAIASNLDSSGACIGVLPEATLDASGLQRWQEHLASTASMATDVSWVLAGTGAVADAASDGQDTDGIYNRAVVIDRLSGEPLFSQAKRSRFTMDVTQVQSWRLGSRMPARAATEDIDLGGCVTVVESSLGRIAIAICEDVTRLAEVGADMKAVGVSLLLVPVFSKELRQHHWEDAAAKAYHAGMGATVVVSNSLAVTNARRADPDQGPDPFRDDDGWGTCFVRGPEFVLRRSADATDVQTLPLRLALPLDLDAGRGPSLVPRS